MFDTQTIMFVLFQGKVESSTGRYWSRFRICRPISSDLLDLDFREAPGACAQ